MTINEALTLIPGDVITWTDPDNGLCTRTAQPIATIRIEACEGEYYGDTIVHLAWEDGGELECYAHELSRVPLSRAQELNLRKPTYRRIPCTVLQVDEKFNWPKTMLEIEYATSKGVKQVRIVDQRNVKFTQESK